MRIAAAVLAGAVVLAGARPSPAATADRDAVADAIVAAVRARMGGDVRVAIASLQVRQARAATQLAAIPDAGSRVGGPMRLLLVDASGAGAGQRIGSADAVVSVEAAHVVARNPVARRQRFEAGAVGEVIGDVGRVPLQRWPRLADVVGSAAKRDVRAGDPIAFAHIVRPALVERGDEVATIARVGAVEVRSRARAAEAGALGEPVRVVVNRRTLRARVVGEREVEVMP
jgi:flagella basal body P-ring formation protein FlgA